jgi:superfamily I DNA/RNA helicase
VLGENLGRANDKVSISTMHLAKGLEFHGVAVMACDDNVLPLQERIEEVSDESASKRSTTPSGIFFVSLVPARVTDRS